MPQKELMHAAVIHRFSGIEQIQIEEVPIPKPKPHEVQIAVAYGGINPVDWKICEGLLKSMFEYQFPIILGWDVSGTISAVGENVENLKVGDPVFAYCRKEIVHDGSFAEYLCLDANHVVKKPHNLSFAEAASIPLSALTAWQSLFDSAHLHEKENVLIHAGAGGVGGFAIQLAKYAGARVVTTASASNTDYVKRLGADEVIDYTHENFVDKVHTLYPQGMDVVYDTVGGNTLKASYEIAKEGGRLITIAGIVDHALAHQRHLEASFVLVSPNGKELKQIADLFENGKLKPPRIEEIPLAEVESALRKSREKHTQGKMVLAIR